MTSTRGLVVVALLGAIAIVAALAPLGALGVLQPGVLMFLPALLLATALLAGRYPGERLIERWTRARPVVRHAAALAASPARFSTASPRGGRLIAVALAGRAPPAFAAG